MELVTRFESLSHLISSRAVKPSKVKIGGGYACRTKRWTRYTVSGTYTYTIQESGQGAYNRKVREKSSSHHYYY
jgi:hypothetical protein